MDGTLIKYIDISGENKIKLKIDFEVNKTKNPDKVTFELLIYNASYNFSMFLTTFRK